jgi:hypothetical protein
VWSWRPENDRNATVLRASGAATTNLIFGLRSSSASEVFLARVRAAPHAGKEPENG